MECTVSTGSSIEQAGARDRMISRGQQQAGDGSRAPARRLPLTLLSMTISSRIFGKKPNRYCIFAKTTQINQLASVDSMDQLTTVSARGGKVLTNHSL